jgi:23S rRNA (uracil1939-C5)-methyltransferase
MTSKGHLMVIIAYYFEDENGPKLMDALLKAFPQIDSLYYVVNHKMNDFTGDLDFHLYHGMAQIQEDLGHLTFNISPKSFFQTNSKQAKTLYDITKEYAGLTGTERVYDLYTGTGSIALYVADQAKEVFGIEYVEAAIEDAKENAKLNGISNCQFFAGDMAKELNDSFIAKHGQPDVIIADPPRAGMHADVIDMLLKIKAPRIVYVSCNPVTQARDLQLLDAAYRVLKIQPVDMFPQTKHVENIALLELK